MRFSRCFCTWALGLLACLIFPESVRGTALDDYVAAPDSNYSYSHVHTDSDLLTGGYILDMNSQGWRDC